MYNAFYSDSIISKNAYVNDYPIEKGPVFAVLYKLGHEMAILLLILYIIFVIVLLYKAISNLRAAGDNGIKEIPGRLLVGILGIHLSFMTLTGCIYEVISFQDFEIQPLFGFSSFNMSLYVFEILAIIVLDKKIVKKNAL